MTHFRFVACSVLLLCLTGIACGCGGGMRRAAVKGKVTVNGAPLPEGTISFVGLDKHAGPSAGAAIAKGEYAIAAAQGPVEGNYQVQIQAFRGTGKKTWDGMGDEHAPASKKRMVEQTEPYIPTRYNDRSELRAKIEYGKVNVHDFDLQLDKKGR